MKTKEIVKFISALTGIVSFFPTMHYGFKTAMNTRGNAIKTEEFKSDVKRFKIWGLALAISFIVFEFLGGAREN